MSCLSRTETAASPSNCAAFRPQRVNRRTNSRKGTKEMGKIIRTYQALPVRVLTFCLLVVMLGSLLIVATKQASAGCREDCDFSCKHLAADESKYKGCIIIQKSIIRDCKAFYQGDTQPKFRFACGDYGWVRISQDPPKIRRYAACQGPNPGPRCLTPEKACKNILHNVIHPRHLKCKSDCKRSC